MLNIDPYRSARSLALYDWTEYVDFSNRRDFLFELIHEIGVIPCKVQLKDISGQRKKNISAKSSDRLGLAVQIFGTFDSFEFTRPIEKNYNNPQLSMTMSTNPYRNYHVQKDEPEFNLIEVVQHVRTFCKEFTPEYGFSNVMESSDSIWFCSGVSTTSMDRETTKRASAIDELRLPVGTPFPIKGRFHDIYELNVLSPKHLDREVFGQSLTKWISQGGRGELVLIKKDVTLWLVPDDIRPRIREQFFKAGLLLVPV